MAADDELSRRTLLSTVGASTVAGFAGCETFGSDAGGTPTTETVTFTDDPTATPGSTTAGTATTTPTTPEEYVFDGGDIEAFHEAVTTADQEGIGTLAIEPGTYRFAPRREDGPGPVRGHASFRDVTDVTIEGNGSTLVFTEPLRAGLVFVGGGPLTMRNLSLDYDPVPFSQGTITGVAMEDRRVRIALDAGFPSLSHPMFDEADSVYALVHEPDGELLSGYRKRGSWDPKLTAVEAVDDRTFDLTIHPAFQSGGLEEGRRLSVLARNNLATFKAHFVTDLVLENVGIHAANGAAFNLTVCRDPRLQECVVAPRRDSDRLIGSIADGIRLINCESSCRVEGCRHEYVGDDSLVIQNTIAPVTEVLDDRTVAVKDIHPFVVGTDDVLQVLSPTGVRKGDLPAIDTYDPRFSSPGEREKPRTITFADDIADSLEIGDFLRNPAAGSQHFQVRDNEFRHHRANLIRIAASDGVIENNVLEGCPINPIELETETGGVFAPKGWTSDVVVRNNTIRAAGLEYFAGANPVGVHVHHFPASGYTSEGYPNRNIRIEDNEIDGAAVGGIHVEAARNVDIAGNTMRRLNQMDVPGFADVGVSLARVRNGVVRENSATGTSAELTYFGVRRESRGIQTASNTVTIDGHATAGEVVQLSPVRVVFSATESPADGDAGSGDTRELAFRCRALRLLDETGAAIRNVEIGAEEQGVAFGSGVFPPSRDGEWRWFGGDEQEAWLYFAGTDLDAAGTLELRGYPFVKDLTIELHRDGRVTDSVPVDNSDTQWYEFDLG